MADLESVFRTLADQSTGEGLALHSKVEGASPSSSRGLIGFSFKDDLGNVILPQLNSAGELPVTTEGAGVCKTNHDTNAGSTSEVTIVDVAIDNSKKITSIEWLASSFRNTIWKIQHVDDEGGGGELITTLSQFHTGSGQYSLCCKLDCLEFNTGASGTQKLRIRGENTKDASTMQGTINARQV